MNVNIELCYDKNAFNYTNGLGPGDQGMSGVFEIDLKVTFASGHIEYFTSQNYSNDNGPIVCPVGSNYMNRVLTDFPNTAYNSYERQNNTFKCTVDYPWYSKGQRQIQSFVNSAVDYRFLTRIKPIKGPGNLQEAGYYTNYTAPRLRLLQKISYNNDPVAWALNAFDAVNPDGSTSARQVIRQLDVLAQDDDITYTSLIDGKDLAWFAANYTPANSLSNLSNSPNPVGGYFDHQGQYSSGAVTSYDFVNS